jgi:pentatricopeptide repeat protein
MCLQQCQTVITYYSIIFWQTHEASKVFEHLVSLGVKPNAKSYSVLVDAHLTNRDVKSALAVIDDMVIT